MNRPLQIVESSIRDRITLMAVLLVICFVSILLLSSQSRASYPTYALAILMLATFPQWRDVFTLSLARWILALLVWLAASALWSDSFDLRRALSVWIRALLVFCFVIAFAECQLRGQLQRWMDNALTLFGALTVVLAIAYFHIENPTDGRLNGLGQLDTHVIAALVYGGIGLFALRIYLSSEQSWVKVLVCVVLLAIGYAVFASDSRNAWVSVVLATSTFLISHIVKDPKQFLVMLVSLGFLFAVCLGLLMLNDATAEVLLPRGDSYRIAIWQATLERFEPMSYVFGRGILSNDDLAIGEMVFPHAHSMYLSVLHQGGLVGLLLFLVVIFKSVQTLLQYYENRDAKLALGMLLLAGSAYILDGHELIDKVGDTWLLFWLPVAVALGLQWRPGSPP